MELNSKAWPKRRSLGAQCRGGSEVELERDTSKGFSVMMVCRHEVATGGPKIGSVRVGGLLLPVHEAEGGCTPTPIIWNSRVTFLPVALSTHYQDRERESFKKIQKFN